MRSRLIFFVFLSLAHPNLEAEIRIRTLDVGEGLSILITSNKEALLIDSGNPTNAHRLSNRLLGLVGRKTFSLVSTHLHQDHIGALYNIADVLKVRRYFDNGETVPEKDEPYRWYKEFVREKNRDIYQTIREGDEIKFNGARILVLSPPVGNLSGDWNENSLVLKVQSGKFCGLIMGDALTRTEDYLLSKHSAQLRCQFIQIGHHGSAFASSPAFIRTVGAKIGAVSVNANNIRGYPDQTKLNAWNANGTKIFRTDMHGDILVTGNSDGSFSLELGKQ